MVMVMIVMLQMKFGVISLGVANPQKSETATMEPLFQKNNKAVQSVRITFSCLNPLYNPNKLTKKPLVTQFSINSLYSTYPATPTE